jgi:uncharacterized protein YoxC
MVYQICAVLFVIAVIILVLWIIRTLNAVKGFLTTADETLKQMRTQVNHVTKETSELLNSHQQLVRDIQGKIHSLDHVFPSENEVSVIQRAVVDKPNRIEQVTKIVGLGLNAWKSWKTFRKSKVKTTNIPKGVHLS